MKLPITTIFLIITLPECWALLGEAKQTDKMYYSIILATDCITIQSFSNVEHCESERDK
jgi:hypothetical protein